VTPLRRLRPTLLDRYIIREILPPFGLGLLLFTFILLLQQITLLTGVLISRSADLATVLRVFANLLPSMFSVTIPMAVLLGVLLAFGRLASESEIIALRASGVSPAVMLRPVVLLSLLATSVTFYVMAYALPDANQSYRQIMFSLIVNKARTAVKPRVFADDLLPGSQLVLYVTDIPASTGLWTDIFMHDAQNPREPAVILARQGQLVIDEARRSIVMYLKDGSRYTWNPTNPADARRLSFKEQIVPLPEDAIFPQGVLSKGDREMTIQELVDHGRELTAQGQPDRARQYWVELHKKFAIPLACFVFGLLGLGLSLGGKKEARSAAFGLSIAVIFIYYVLIRLGEQAGDAGRLPVIVAVWGANVILGAIAVVLLVLNHREAAFDPLDPEHYKLRLRFKRRPKAAAVPAPSALAEGPPLRPVVVLRIPRPSFRVLALLDLHIARSYLGVLALVTAGFWAIYTLVHFLDLYDDIDQHKIKGAMVLHYYAFYAPAIVHLMANVAILVTTLTTLGVLARRNEVTAMKAAGVSVYRVCLPVLMLGFLGSGVMFAMSEFLLPYTNRIANRDFNVIKGRPPQSSSYFEKRWILGHDGRFYYYDYLQEGGAIGAVPSQGASEGVTLYGLSAFEVDPQTWELREHLYANRAVWDGAAYDLQSGWRRRYKPTPAMRLFEQTRSREIEGPSYFRREDKDTDTLRFGELRSQIATLEARGLDVAKLRVQLHRKLAFPLVAVVMTLIGIPFAFVVARRGALYGIGLSILIAIVYYTTFSVFEHLGNNGLLPPVLAAWAPNLIFSTAGLYLMLNLET
jgi:LPS export ABC transporter permease LptF/LPS export ABC transporter permease LptG